MTDPQVRDDIVFEIRKALGFFDKELDDQNASYWLAAIGTQDSVAAVRAALLDHMRESRMAPRPADVVRRLAEKRPRSEGPREPERPHVPAPADVSAAWAWLIKHWGLGALYHVEAVTQEQEDAYLELCNRQAKASDSPDSIPPDCWLAHVWGCAAHEKQSQHLHQEVA